MPLFKSLMLLRIVAQLIEIVHVWEEPETSSSFATSCLPEEPEEEASKSKKKKTELVPFTFDIDVHANAGVNPQKEYESWCSLIKSTGVLYMHGRRFGRETRLKEVSLSGVIMDDYGRIRFATIGLTFEEVNKKETSGKSGARAAASEAKKAEKKAAKKKGKKVTISVGSSVKLTGSYYADGEKILNSEKKRVLKVGKINGNKAYLPQVDGWVYISTLSLVS